MSSEHKAIQQAIGDLWDSQNLDDFIKGGLSYSKIGSDDLMPFCLFVMPPVEREQTGSSGNQVMVVVTATPTFTVYHTDAIKGLDEASEFAERVIDAYDKNSLVIPGGDLMHMRKTNDGGAQSDDGDYEWMWEIEYEIRASFKRNLPPVITGD